MTQTSSVPLDGRLDNTNSRFHYMDNLRAMAMVMGLFFHAALAYSPVMDNYWPSASAQKSVPLDMFAWFAHLFRMPLFFVIAGFFGLMVLQKRGVKSYLLNRSKRLLAPLLVFLPLVTISVSTGLVWALGNVDNLSTVLEFVKAGQANADAPKPPLSTVHLWFLYYLCYFCLCLVIVHRLGLFGAQWLKKMITAKTVLLLYPLLLVPALYSQTYPQPAPDKLMPDLWVFGYYGLFFLLGTLIYQQQSLPTQMKKYWSILLLLSVAGFSYMYMHLPQNVAFGAGVDANAQPGADWHHLLMSVIDAYAGVFLVVLSLMAGQMVLNRPSKILRYISDSSYWVYILHIPLLFFLQYLLLDLVWPLWLEFLVGAFGTWGIGLVSYTLLVRWTLIGRLLNGRTWPFLK